MTTEFQRARTPEQQELRRAAVLDAARRLLDDRPPAEISLRELSQAVGLAKSNVVRYFPTREAVFLAVLVEDWDRWLDDLAATLPAPGAPTAVVGHGVARTLVDHGRFCDLVAASMTILERNIPVDVARTFKRDAMQRLARLGAMLAGAVDGLADEDGVEVAGAVWALLIGAWPMVRPSEVVAEVLAEPEFAAICIDFVPMFGGVVTALLDGTAARR